MMETTIKIDDKLLESAKMITGIAETEVLVEAAIKDFTEREAARQLAELGGTMPDLVAPPRRRQEKW